MSLRVSMSRLLISACSGTHVGGRADELLKGGEERLVGQALSLVALAMPKSITLGTGTPSLTVTRMFDGLMSRWMMPF